MTSPINLNRVRKARRRAAAEALAAENRARFGRSKIETLAGRREAEAAARRLEGHRRQGAPADEEGAE